MTGRKSGDGFLRGVRACNGFLHFVLSAGKRIVTDFSVPHFWWRVSSWRASMPSTSIWVPVVHKTTMGQIVGSNLLLKPMRPAKIQIHATPLKLTMSVYHPHLHRQHHCTVTCSLESAICVGFLDWFLIGAKKEGVMSESRSVLMAESNIAMVVDVPRDMPVPRNFSVADTQAMTDRIP